MALIQQIQINSHKPLKAAVYDVKAHLIAVCDHFQKKPIVVKLEFMFVVLREVRMSLM